MTEKILHAVFYLGIILVIVSTMGFIPWWTRWIGMTITLPYLVVYISQRLGVIPRIMFVVGCLSNLLVVAINNFRMPVDVVALARMGITIEDPWHSIANSSTIFTTLIDRYPFWIGIWSIGDFLILSSFVLAAGWWLIKKIDNYVKIVED